MSQANPSASTDATTEASPPRFVVGIDLGTTNSALCYVDTARAAWQAATFTIPQWVDLGQIERRDTLPSFHYELTDAEAAGVDFRLPWQQQAHRSCVGVLARDAGMRNPGRRAGSAKSWLSHEGVDRTAELLPWHGDADVQRMSPVDASASYLIHLRSAWDADHPDDPLDQQDVIITLPASFDEVARELTVQAARQAGLPRIYLIEEPQAAFYAWIHRQGDNWQDQVQPGQLILVCDIGGGTTDLTLIRVRPAGAGGRQVQFHRVAVGRHLILGGDNLDLAVAKLAETKLTAGGDAAGPLAPRQWDRLVQAARLVKETMLSENRPAAYTINLPAEGSRLIGGGTQLELTAADIDAALLDGFFPIVPLDARPAVGQSGFQEFGLPYAADPAVTRHLAAFLAQHRRSGLDDDDPQAADRPDMVLFNGGVLASAVVRQRIVDCVGRWFASPDDPQWRPRVLASERLDLAVAQGAAYYGMVRRGEGVRIAANLGRSYYMQVADDPPVGMCLIPGSAEAGQRFRADSHPLELQVGAPVQFPLWVSSTRLADTVGQLVPIGAAEASPLPPICTALMRGRRNQQAMLRVVVEAELSEIGTVGLFCVDQETGRRWRLEFDIRSTLETDRTAHEGAGEAAGIVDAETVERCQQAVDAVFGPSGDQRPGRLVKQLQAAADLERGLWPPSLLRAIWQALADHQSQRSRSPQHESRWLNLVGYCLRPGYGVAVDDWRVAQTWRMVHGKLAFPAAASKTEAMILWRRIAGGLSPAQQNQLAAPLLATLRGKTGRVEPHEAAEVWRLVGSLERLPVPVKVELAGVALQAAQQKKNEKIAPALLWAIGRLGSRQPAYGPLNSTVDAQQVARWVEQLTRLPADRGGLPLAIVQLARRTGDRFRDLPATVVEDAVAWLRAADAPPHYIELLTTGGRLKTDEEAAVFGESLPLGIRLLR